MSGDSYLRPEGVRLPAMIERYNSAEHFEIVNQLALAMRDEGSFRHNGWNREKLRRLLDAPTVFCALVRDEDGYYGGIIGLISEQFFSDDLVASDLGLFILPRKRGGSAAPRLVKAFEDWAIGMGAREIHLGQTTGVEVDRTRRLYEALGYEIVGFCSKKEVGDVR